MMPPTIHQSFLISSWTKHLLRAYHEPGTRLVQGISSELDQHGSRPQGI